MDENMVRGVDSVFAKAHNEGRTTLYEFEIYEILNKIGIETPKYLFRKDPAQVSEDDVQGFGERIVLKIVSPDIAHKQKLGGVKILKAWNRQSLRTTMEDMQTEVLSHFSKDQQPAIEGFLIAEFVPYNPSLGNETMIGCREDGEFGPVVLVSKGGDDAEFFAKHYDPANILLPPLSPAEALDFVENLNISQKFRQQGNEEYINLIATTIRAVAQLAHFYSSASQNRPKYRLLSLDINPLVITDDGRLVAIDGYGEFLATKNEKKELHQANAEHLEMFFRPQSVAVIGVSTNLAKPNMAREIAKLLHKAGQEDLYLVNPRGGTMQINDVEYPLHKDFEAIGKVIDLVVYVLPIANTAEFVKDLSGRAKAVIVISGLPADLEYTQFVAEMDQVRPKELRLIGPNCMGVFFAPGEDGMGVNTLFIEEEKLGLKYSETSNTALLTQSGALALTSIDAVQDSKIFKAIVSFGNQYDVKITDLLAHFSEDPQIDFISLYIEGLSPGEGRVFFELARKITKPILVYKTGKTEAGAKAAASHTAAMSGNYEVFKAAAKQGGVILAEKLEEFYDFLRIFSLLAKKKPQGKRVAAVFNAGFESTIAADELKHLEPASLDAQTRVKLRETDVHSLVDLSTALLDVTPMADDQLFTDYVEIVLQDQNVDCVLVSIVPHSNALKSGPDKARDTDGMASLLVELGRKYQKPLVVSVNGARYYDEFVRVMEEGGLPVYRNPRAAIQALETFLAYHLGLQ
jgi:acyl-CoA synthetase (NDP forming)